MTLHRPKPRYGWHGETSQGFCVGARVRWNRDTGDPHPDIVGDGVGVILRRSKLRSIWIVNWDNGMEWSCFETHLEVIS